MRQAEFVFVRRLLVVPPQNAANAGHESEGRRCQEGDGRATAAFASIGHALSRLGALHSHRAPLIGPDVLELGTTGVA